MRCYAQKPLYVLIRLEVYSFCLCLHIFFVCLFCCFTSQVNGYGHCGMVSSPNHTFFLSRFEQAVNQYFKHILSLVTDNNPS